MSTLRVLIVEDSEDDVLLVVRELRKNGFEPVVHRVETEQAMRRALESDTWDVVISDHVMPEFNSFQALRVLKQSGLDIPFILVSGSIGEETAVESMRAGVHDFVMKDKLGRLGPAVTREVKDARHRKDKRAAYEDLVAAKKAAEAASEAKSAFLANMSHEIRTPLNGIMGLLQLLGTTEMQESQRRFVNLAQASAERLTTLLSDILDICSIESGQMELRQTAMNIRDVSETTLDHFTVAAAEKDLVLEGEYDARLPQTLHGDEVRVRQILFILIGNAVKFTASGSIRVNISLVGRNVNQLRVLISVSDTGIGMSEDQVEELFKPFVQQDSSNTRKYQGAGLGLAIVKRLVDLMHGNIAVESLPGEGATFHVLLPLQIPDGAETMQASEKKSLESVFPGATVLYAEDDPANQLTVRLLLEQAGLNVLVADDGQAALDQLARQDVHCVLMDVQMPVMGGIEATRAIRNGIAGPEKRNIPIIALTARAMPGDRERMLQAGMTDYLVKPVRFEELKQKVECHCRKDSDRGSSTTS
ncbi:MAG: response regulator [Desulfovibrionales bacterium]|nr:MAG: response regulator [Desulfovibrionales bacterium]